jgi:hypothetical protein
MAKQTTRSQGNDKVPGSTQPLKPRRSRAAVAAARPSGDGASEGPTTDARNQSMNDSADERTSSVSMGSEPSEEDIRLRAYHRYLERGGNDGLDFDDWVAAEEDLRRRR